MEGFVEDKLSKSKSALFNWSTLTLILTNLYIVYYFVAKGLGISTLLWIYWFQSIIIGVFTIFKILRLKDFTTDKVKINGRPVNPSTGIKILMAGFFTLHYGIFHLVYAMFLLFDTFAGNLFSTNALGPDWGFILSAAGIFFINHLFSFFYNNDSHKKQNIGKVMMFPYARIIPMHFIIIAGAFLGHGTIAIIFFIILKTIADVITHVIEHNNSVASLKSQTNYI